MNLGNNGSVNNGENGSGSGSKAPVKGGRILLTLIILNIVMFIMLHLLLNHSIHMMMMFLGGSTLMQ